MPVNTANTATVDHPRHGLRRPTAVLRSLAVVLAFALVASACGDGTDSTAATGQATGTANSAATSAAAPTSTTGSISTTGSTDTAATTARSSTTAKARPITVADVERDLEATINADGAHPGEAGCQARGELSDWQVLSCTYNPVPAAEFGPIYLVMLDNRRYAWAVGGCCDSSPAVEYYPSGLLCRDLLEPPPGFEPGRWQPELDHLTYGLAVWYWVAEGRPERMDADGNGIPCETVYPKEDVDRYWASARTIP